MSNITASETELFNVALSLFNKKLYFLSRENFYSVINTSNNHDLIEQSYYYAALASFYNKQYKNAIYDFSLLFLNYPNTRFKEKADLFTCESLYYLNNYIGTVRGLKKFLKTYPDTIFKDKVYELLGKSLYFMGYNRKAVKYMKNSKSGESKFYTALAYIKMNKFSDALDYLKPLLKDNDFHSKEIVYFYIGNIFYKEKNFKEAEFYLYKIKTENTEIYTYSRLMLADIEFAKGDFEKSYLLLKNIKSDSDNYKLSVARVLFKLGKEKEAVDLLLSVDKSKYTGSTYYTIGYYFLKNNEFDKSINYFKNALKVYNKDISVISSVYISKAFYKIKKFDKMAEYILPLNEKEVPANILKDYIFLKGLAYFYSEHFDKAVLYLEKYVKNYKYNDDVIFTLGVSCYKANKFDKAVKYFSLAFNKYKEIRIKVFPYLLKLYKDSPETAADLYDMIYNNINADEKKEYAISISELLYKKENYSKLKKYLDLLNTFALNKNQKQLIDFLYVKYYINKGDFTDADFILTTLINNAESEEELAKYYWTKYELLKKQDKMQEADLWLNKLLALRNSIRDDNEYIKKAVEVKGEK